MWANILCVFPSCLPKLALTVLVGSTHSELATVWGFVLVRCAEHWGCPLASWVDPWLRHPYWFMAGLLDGVCDTANRICTTLMPSKNPICYLFPPPTHATHNSALWMGQENNGPFWQHAAQFEKLHANSHILTCPCRRNHWPGRSLLALSCAVLGEAWCWKGKLFLLPCPMHPNSYIFILLQKCAGTSLLETWISTQKLSCSWMIV